MPGLLQRPTVKNYREPEIQVLPGKEKETVIRERDQWNDRLEAIEFLTKVQTSLDEHINSDMVLAKLSERQQEFIIQNTKQAFCLYRQVKPMDAAAADRLFKTMVVESIMICLLNRNVDKNQLLGIVGGIHDQEPETPVLEPETVGRAFLSKFGIGKKKQEEQP